MSAVPQSELDNAGPYQLQRLKAVHHLIMDMHMRGLTNKEIADELERSPVGIGLIIQCPLFQQELARKQHSQDKTNVEQRSLYVSRAKEVLDQNAERAALKVIEQIDNPDANVAQRSAFGILDRVFPKEQRDGTNNNFNGPTVILGADALKLLQRAQNEDREVFDQEPVTETLLPSSADTETAKLSSDTLRSDDSTDVAGGATLQVDGL